MRHLFHILRETRSRGDFQPDPTRSLMAAAVGERLGTLPRRTVHVDYFTADAASSEQAATDADIVDGWDRNSEEFRAAVAAAPLL